MKVNLFCLLLLLSQSLPAEISIQSYRHSYSWKNEWSEALRNELKREDYRNRGNTILNMRIDAEDLNELECSGYNSASIEEKNDFWIAFFSSLTRAESAFNPKAVSGKSRGHRSYGLLQLSKQTAKNSCEMNPESNAVFDPEQNLKCGVRLMQWQLQGAPSKSGKKLRADLEGQLFGKRIFQWGPLRQDDHRGRKLLLGWFKSHLDQLPFCSKKS